MKIPVQALVVAIDTLIGSRAFKGDIPFNYTDEARKNAADQLCACLSSVQVEIIPAEETQQTKWRNAEEAE